MTIIHNANERRVILVSPYVITLVIAGTVVPRFLAEASETVEQRHFPS
jgi:hypothetical protein